MSATLKAIVILLFLCPSIAAGQSEKRTPISLIYEAIAATNAILWLAEDARLFESTDSTRK